MRTGSLLDRVEVELFPALSTSEHHLVEARLDPRLRFTLERDGAHDEKPWIDEMRASVDPGHHRAVRVGTVLSVGEDRLGAPPQGTEEVKEGRRERKASPSRAQGNVIGDHLERPSPGPLRAP